MVLRQSVFAYTLRYWHKYLYSEAAAVYWQRYFALTSPLAECSSGKQKTIRILRPFATVLQRIFGIYIQRNTE
jgi:hypothetical protein